MDVDVIYCDTQSWYWSAGVSLVRRRARASITRTYVCVLFCCCVRRARFQRTETYQLEVISAAEYRLFGYQFKRRSIFHVAGVFGHPSIHPTVRGRRGVTILTIHASKTCEAYSHIATARRGAAILGCGFIDFSQNTGP